MKSTSWVYFSEIQGWDFSLLEQLVVPGNLATSHSSSEKSQPCIFGKYTRLVLFVVGAAGITGVGLLSAKLSVTSDNSSTSRHS